jgi:hypothetical protein
VTQLKYWSSLRPILQPVSWWCNTAYRKESSIRLKSFTLQKVCRPGSKSRHLCNIAWDELQLSQLQHTVYCRSQVMPALALGAVRHVNNQAACWSSAPGMPCAPVGIMRLVLSCGGNIVLHRLRTASACLLTFLLGQGAAALIYSWHTVCCSMVVLTHSATGSPRGSLQDACMTCAGVIQYLSTVLSDRKRVSSEAAQYAWHGLAVLTMLPTSNYLSQLC